MRLPPCSSFPALATAYKISRACHRLCADSLLDWFIELLPAVEPTEGDWGWFKSVEGRNLENELKTSLEYYCLVLPYLPCLKLKEKVMYMLLNQKGVLAY